MRADQLAEAGGGRDICGRCGNRCRGPLCDRCRRELDDQDQRLLRELRAEQERRRYAPR